MSRAATREPRDEAREWWTRRRRVEWNELKIPAGILHQKHPTRISLRRRPSSVSCARIWRRSSERALRLLLRATPPKVRSAAEATASPPPELRASPPDEDDPEDHLQGHADEEGNLRIQLAINTQIPVYYGGLGGKEVYIDTEGSFMVERVYQIAEGCISDTMEYFPCHHDKASSGHGNLQPKRFLAGIYYFQICSYTEQIAVINYLEKFLREHTYVKIIIIDSVTFHFRQDVNDLAPRTRVLSGLSLKLMKLSKAYNLAVVLLNQVTSKFTEGSFQLLL